MFSIIFLIIIILNDIDGKFLSNPDNSGFLILKHLRLSTDNEQYNIQCPYNLNYLTLRLLNYSNENCFNLYSTLNNNNPCKNHYSSCKFHSKSVQLHCNHHSYSKQVDITYQCSYKPINSPEVTFSPESSNPEENIALFLIGFGIVIIFWILICCIWVIRCHYDDDKCELISSSQTYPKEDLISFNKNNLLITDNLCLHVNPFENNHISSLRTTKIV